MSVELADLTRQLRMTRRTLDQRTGAARSLAVQGQRVRDEVAELRQRISNCEKAAELLSRIGEERQTATQHRIEALVTQGLRTIFGPELSFHLVPGVRAKTPVVDFIVRSSIDGETVDTDVMDARGGGLAVTVGFLLQVVVLLLSKHRQDTVLFLDETFAFLSEDHHAAMAQFLRELTDKTGIQVIMVTHTPALAEHADTVYRFELHNGATKVTELAS